MNRVGFVPEELTLNLAGKEPREVGELLDACSPNIVHLVLRGPGYSPLLTEVERFFSLAKITAEDEYGLVGALFLAKLHPSISEVVSPRPLTEGVRQIYTEKFPPSQFYRRITFELPTTAEDRILLSAHFPGSMFVGENLASPTM